MKKYVLMIIMLLMVIPQFVFADIIPVWSTLYSEDEVGVGSVITYKVAGYARYNGSGSHSDLNGKIIYNAEQLKVSQIYVKTSACYYDECGDVEDQHNASNTKMNISKNENGIIEYTITTDSRTINNAYVYVMFEIKEIPSDDSIKVNFIPTDKTVINNANFLTAELDMEETEEDNGYTGEDEFIDDSNNNTDSEKNDENKTEEDDESYWGYKTKESDSKNTILLIALIGSVGINLLLVVLLIIFAIKYKTKNEI